MMTDRDKEVEKKIDALKVTISWDNSKAPQEIHAESMYYKLREVESIMKIFDLDKCTIDVGK